MFSVKSVPALTPDGDAIGRVRALTMERGLRERLFAQAPELSKPAG